MLSSLAALIRGSSVRTLAVAAFLIRLLVIGYSVLHDKYLPVPYTDVDYLVVSDGARHMYEGRSPFDRETYRYTPLLALVVLPNMVLGAWWGKAVLALCDVVAGYFVLRVLFAQVDAAASSSQQQKQQQQGQAKLLVAAFIWFNPVVINVSTRGNSDIIIAAFALGSLAAFTQQRYWAAGLFLGFAVHMKIYPIIYAAPFVFALLHRVISKRRQEQQQIQAQQQSQQPRKQVATAAPPAAAASPSVVGGILSAAFSGEFLGPVLRAAAATVLAAAIPTAACYAVYGQQFLHEAILYHIGRIDHRHNLSPYFLQMYYGLLDLEIQKVLQVMTNVEPASRLTSGLFAFVPQMLMLVVVSWVLRRNAAHAVALETMLFVAFNKVCTVQYFVWYLPFLPFIFFTSAKADAAAALPQHQQSTNRALIGACVFWVLALGAWMLHGKLLEFDGVDTFVRLWACSCIFFVAQVVLAVVLLRTALRSGEHTDNVSIGAAGDKKKAD